ncbi:MAG: Uncharacterized protein JWQ27_1640 [Ferruginibacter sp.]|nr:Uncharacterized protein [Ferruginibacter sp.]
MKKILLALAILSSCGRQEKNKTVMEKSPADTAVTIQEDGSPQAANEKPVKIDSTKTGLRTGRHGLSLQWLLFNKSAPGIAFINKTDDAEWLSIRGEQQSSEGYLKINGKIKMAQADKLLFEGEIIFSTTTGTGGEVCEKKGSQVFLSTKNRKYWRLQDMTTCNTGNTSYIDIYFD